MTDTRSGLARPVTGPGAATAIAAIGARVLVRGFALAGVRVLVAEDRQAVRDAWRSLPDDVGLVLLTADAAQALPDELRPERIWPLVVVMS